VSNTALTTLLNFRTKRFWLIIIFLAYSLFGWFGVPAIIESQLSSVLKDTAQWEVKIENTVFNPYALSLEIEQAHFKDVEGKSVVDFDRFYIDFDLLSSLTGTLSFDEISLEHPIVNVTIDKSGSTNFQRDFTSNTDEASPETIIEEESDALALFFALISIKAGEINFLDQTADEEYSAAIAPLNLALANFSTHHNKGGDYTLAISLGQGQEINWKGQIGIAPFSTKGHLTLKNIRSDSFWHYVKGNSPYWLNQALISLEGQYDTAIIDDATQLVIDQTSFSVTQLKVAENAESDNLLELASLNISPISFDLNQLALSLGQITLNEPIISALRYPNSEVNLLRPLNANENMKGQADDTNLAPSSEVEFAQEPTDNTSAISENKKAQDFKWDISGIKINSGAINWQDQSLKTPADLHLTDLSIILGRLSDDLSQAFPYQFAFNTDEGQHSLSGELSPTPFNIEGKLSIQKFPLHWLQNYLSESANISLDSGTASLNSQYQLAMNESLQGQIISDFSLDQLAIRDTLLTKPLSGIEHFSISPIDIQFKDTQEIEIGTIKLIKPYGEVFISKEGQMNLATLSTANENTEEAISDSPEIESTEADSPEVTGTEDTVETGAPHINIKKVAIEAGRFEFTDASQNPTFNTYFDQVRGTIKHLSSDLETRSKVDIQGNLETYGKLFVRGTLNPLSQKPYTDLNIKVSNINLNTASPYSGKYAGYLIDKGKLDLDLNYLINNKNLNANNHIFIDQFEFGDSVDSPDATSLPLPFAIGIMKNLDGEIDIDLPISGDLDDPSFSIGSVMLTAFTNIITKAVTSPFSILGALVEGDDDISSVDFAAGQAKIDTEQHAKILKLAKALNERPNLILEIRGIADQSLDGQVDLTLLAKDRAQAMAQTIIEQGGIPKERIFILGPQVIGEPDAKAMQVKDPQAPSWVKSNFTISVN